MTKTDASTGHNLFRKKPVVIEAWHYDGVNVPMNAALAGCRMLETNALAWDYDHGAYRDPKDGRLLFTGEGGMRPDHLIIPTLEGDMLVSPGDWIIKGVQGEFYPCKPDIFAATYDPTDTKD